MGEGDKVKSGKDRVGEGDKVKKSQNDLRPGGKSVGEKSLSRWEICD